jgi:uncharacterized membrane protein
VGIFSFKRSSPSYFTQEENANILSAIRHCEQRTSGEIRVYIESHNPYVNILERAAEIFYKLEMDETHHRNGVLIYIALQDHEVALFADEGIYRAVGQAYWENEVKEMIQYFKGNQLSDGIINSIHHIGEALHTHFPYIATEDKNELPDEIVFGK